MCGESVHAVSHCRVRVRDLRRVQAAIDRLPVDAVVIAAKRAGGGNRHGDTLRALRVEQDGMQAHTSRAGHPVRAGRVTAQAVEFLPAVAAVTGAKQCGVLDPGDGTTIAGDLRPCLAGDSLGNRVRTPDSRH